jgi:hypothetical protein
MSLLNRIENITKLWRMVLPNIPPPPAAWIGRLCSFPDEAIEHAIVRASKRFSPDRVDGTPEPEHAWRFVAAVAAGEAKQIVQRQVACSTDGSKAEPRSTIGETPYEQFTYNN